MVFGPFQQLTALTQAPGMMRYAARLGAERVLLLRLPLCGPARALSLEQLRLRTETDALRGAGWPLLASGALPREGGGLELYWALPWDAKLRPLEATPSDLGAALRWLISELELGRHHPVLSLDALGIGPRGVRLSALPLVAREDLYAPECPPPWLAPEERADHLHASGTAWRLGKALAERMGGESAWEGLIRRLLETDPGRRLTLEAALARIDVGPWDGAETEPSTSVAVLAALDIGPEAEPPEPADPWADLRGSQPSTIPTSPQRAGRGIAWASAALALTLLLVGIFVS